MIRFFEKIDNDPIYAITIIIGMSVIMGLIWLLKHTDNDEKNA